MDSSRRRPNRSIITVKKYSAARLNHLLNLFKEQLQIRAKSENIPLKVIYDDEAQRHQAACCIYPWLTAENSMRYARRTLLPENLEQLSAKFVNGQLSHYSCCNNTMFRGCVRDSDGRRSIIFGCTKLMQLALAIGISEMHVDATFKAVPSNMGNYLLSIHCMIRNYSIPMVYAFMESKTRNSYECVLDFIKINMLPDLSPQIIITDYDTVLIETLRMCFGDEDTKIVGSWFHHNQAVWRKMKAFNYLETVTLDENALKSLNMLMCLPLLPPMNLKLGFYIVKYFAINNEVFMPKLFEYYERYWTEEVKPENLSLKGKPRRTNHNFETFHYSFLKTSFNDPSLWAFLDKIRDSSLEYHAMLNQISNDSQPPRNLRTKFLLNSNRLKSATDEHDSGDITIFQFISRCSQFYAEFERQQRAWDRRFPMDEIDADSQLEIIPIFDSKEKYCMICQVVTFVENVPQYIVLPCGHAWICEECVESLKSQIPKRCPMCRCNVDNYKRIYYN